MDFKLAWRNIWRNPRRSILTMAAIAFATLLLIFMLSWQFGSYETMINASVKIQTGHLQVQAKGYQDKREIRKVISNPEAVGKIFQQIDSVAAYTYRTQAFSLISSKDRTYGTMVVGIDPDKEARVSTIENIIWRGEYFKSDDTGKALVGKLLARNLRVDTGDELIILGQGKDGSVAATVVLVKGIFSSGQDDFDRSIVHIPLNYFQQVYAMENGVNAVVAICHSLDDVPGVKRTAGEKIKKFNSLVILDWKELTPGLIQAIKMDLISGFIFYLILIVVVAFSILNTFLMAIFERTREFGVMMAMGIRPGRLTRLLLMESFGLTMLGIVSGTVFGILITSYFQAHGILIPGAEELAAKFGLPERMYPELSFLSISIGGGIVLIITFITALYPALKVRRLKPVEALTAV